MDHPDTYMKIYMCLTYTVFMASADTPSRLSFSLSLEIQDPHAMFKGFSEQFKLDRENSLKRLKEMLLWASTVPPEMFADHDFMDLNVSDPCS